LLLFDGCFLFFIFYFLLGVMGQLSVVVLVAAVVTLVIFGYLCEGKCEIDGIFNFGDSNTDTGGFFAAFPAEKPPFGMTFFKRPAGRASDGRVIVDFLGV